MRLENKNIINEIDYKILATHFKKSKEAMRLLYMKNKKGKKSLWEIYIKAYKFDKIIFTDGNIKNNLD